MAASFYSQDEACSKLDVTPAELKELVRKGSLREFRDAGKVTYKATEVDKLAAADDAGESGAADAGALSGSLGDFDMISTGELTLEDTADKTGGDSPSLRLADDGGEPPKPAPAADGTAGASDVLALSSDESAGGSTADATGTGELILEPIDEGGSGVRLGEDSDADAVSLDDTTDTASEDEDDREGTVVTSIGVSVFDEDEVEQDADPLAQTVVSGGSAGALGIDGVGSRSGLLDLTRESDDTSLGAELLDEIYPGDEGAEMGDDTRAGLEEALPEAGAASSAGFAPPEEATVAAAAAAPAVVTRVEFAPDAVAAGLTGMLFVAVLVMCIAGLAVAAATQGTWPALLESFSRNNWIVGAASLGAALIALGVGYFLGKRSSG